MRDELQELVDRVSALLGAPATLEDADFTLLAFCAHPDSGDDAGPGSALDVSCRTVGHGCRALSWSSASAR